MGQVPAHRHRRPQSVEDRLQNDEGANPTNRSLLGQEAVIPPALRSGGGLVASYEYRNAVGELVAEHGRFEEQGRKSFAWRRPGHNWRDGLGELSLHSLPLYRLQDVLDFPQAPVWFCEGEKAVEACVSKGLVAVCCGGGASQQSFGNALDPLRDREVYLWPDNDEQGQALMGRIHALLPQAQFVRPVVPPKGDACLGLLRRWRDRSEPPGAAERVPAKGLGDSQ